MPRSSEWFILEILWCEDCRSGSVHKNKRSGKGQGILVSWPLLRCVSCAAHWYPADSNMFLS